MIVEDIIRMFDNPAEINEALQEAAKLPFRGDDKTRFAQKRQTYIDGLSDHERPYWVSEMKNFLCLYSNTNVNYKETDVQKYKNYKSDTFKRWHYLDKKNLRSQISMMCREKNTENTVKVVFIQNDYDGCSRKVPQIIESFIKKDNSNIYGNQKLSKIKGSIDRPFIFTKNHTPEIEWEYNMREFFDLSSSFEEIPAEFNNNGLHKKLHIIVHGIQNFDKDCRYHFSRYYDLWAKMLNPEKLIFLCVHIEEFSLYEDEDLLPNYPYYYYETHEKVTKTHFQEFFEHFEDFYQEDEELCNCEDPMTFKYAIKKLKFKGRITKQL